ncbi:serine hydrolase domain-containing protein [Rubritalea tangerina]|uniref:Serine hydrolase domain-containing protein n=2 Tax=Rubritalea tangerina TaxID=430798 RepID=A0ABW4Z920_9BACT
MPATLTSSRELIVPYFESLLKTTPVGPHSSELAYALGWITPNGDDSTWAIQDSAYFGSYLKDPSTNEVVRPSDSTLWEIGSCTKTFAAMSYAFHLAKGHVQRDDKVLPTIAPYLPSTDNLPAALTTMTWDDLRTMRSQLVGNQHKGPSIESSSSVETFFQDLTNKSNYTGNSLFNYSNSSYALLGFGMLIVAHSLKSSTPLSFDEFLPKLREYWYDTLFSPIGMPDTQLFNQQKVDSYDIPHWQNSPLKKANWPAHTPAGGLLTTMPDALNWLTANMKPNGAVPANVIENMRSHPSHTQTSKSNPRKRSGEGQYIANGWFEKFYPSLCAPGKQNSIFIKGGSVPHFRASFAYAKPDNGAISQKGIVILTNDDELSLQPITQNLMDLLIHEIPD